MIASREFPCFQSRSYLPADRSAFAAMRYDLSGINSIALKNVMLILMLLLSLRKSW